MTADPTFNSSVLTSVKDLKASPLGEHCKQFTPIGAGGFGLVFETFHYALQRQVAVKVLLPGLAADEHVKRLHREARTLSLIEHPNVVRVFACGVTPSGSLYIVMEYLSGRLLQDVIDEGSGLPLERTKMLFSQALSAVGALHSHGVLHRDIKPGNFMVVEDAHGEERLKLFDFGLVKLLQGDEQAQKLTTTGTVAGTAEYMSPEQCRGEEITERSDIYSLGCVLYQMYTGKLVFDSDDPYVCMSKHVSEEPLPLHMAKNDGLVCEELQECVSKALSKNPAGRFASTREFDDDLRQAKFLIPAERASHTIRALTDSRWRFIAIMRTALVVVFFVFISAGIYVFLLPAGEPVRNEIHATMHPATSVELFRELHNTYFEAGDREAKEHWLRLAKAARAVVDAEHRDHLLSFTNLNRTYTYLAKSYRLTDDPRHVAICKEGMERFRSQKRPIDKDFIYLLESIRAERERTESFASLKRYLEQCEAELGVDDQHYAKERVAELKHNLTDGKELDKAWKMKAEDDEP